MSVSITLATLTGVLAALADVSASLPDAIHGLTCRVPVADPRSGIAHDNDPFGVPIAFATQADLPTWSADAIHTRSDRVP